MTYYEKCTAFAPKMVDSVVIGMKVIRGKDWCWGDQDGGAGSIGEITDASGKGWARVKWPNRDTNTYRIGAEGKYDLWVYEGNSSTTFSYQSPERNATRRKRLLNEIKFDE